MSGTLFLKPGAAGRVMYRKKETGTGIIARMEYPNRGQFVTEDGQTVTVKNALPGQEVLFRVTKRRDDRADARLLEVLAPSPLETEPPACGVFPACGGCLMQTIPYERQLSIKEEQIRRLFAGIVDEDTVCDGIIGSPEPFGYRNKMEFSFGDEVQGGPLTLGLHKRGTTYDVLDASTCRIVPDDMRAVLSETLAYCTENGLPKYNKKNHTGYLRHLLIRRSASEGGLIVFLITSSQIGHDFSDWAERLLKLPLEGSVTGIFHGINDSMADAVKTDRTVCLYGKDHFRETLLGLSFKVTAFSFFQTNTKGAECLYRLARDYVQPRERGGGRKPVLYDLYSGTGTIGQILSPAAEKVYGIELVEEAVEAARENAALNGIENCCFLAGDVLKMLDEIPEKPDYIVLDPPREGIHPKALRKIMDYDVPEMVYISCKATSFVHDMQEMRKAGWRIRRYGMVDMFPQTGHVETVVLLSKGEIDSRNIQVELSLEDMDLSGFQSNVTYNQIKEWVKEQTGLSVSSLYIAQVKRKYGLAVGLNQNPAKAEGGRVPQCPPEKEAAIKAALEHFRLLPATRTEDA